MQWIPFFGQLILLRRKKGVWVRRLNQHPRVPTFKPRDAVCNKNWVPKPSAKDPDPSACLFIRRQERAGYKTRLGLVGSEFRLWKVPLRNLSEPLPRMSLCQEGAKCLMSIGGYKIYMGSGFTWPEKTYPCRVPYYEFLFCILKTVVCLRSRLGLKVQDGGVRTRWCIGSAVTSVTRQST